MDPTYGFQDLFNTSTISVDQINAPLINVAVIDISKRATLDFLAPFSIVETDASSNLIGTTLTNGQLLIGSTGTAPSAAAITGTANQVIVTPGVGSITLSAPQSIGPTSSPTFAHETLTDAANQIIFPGMIFNINGTTSSTLTFKDPGGADQVIYGAAAQTLSHKTLSLPIIDQIDSVGTLVINPGASITDFSGGDIINLSDLSCTGVLAIGNITTDSAFAGDTLGSNTLNADLQLFGKGTGSVSVIQNFLKVDKITTFTGADLAITAGGTFVKTSNPIKLTAAGSQIYFRPGDAGNSLILTTSTPATADRTVNLPDPGAAADIIYNVSAQTISGIKTFSSAPVINQINTTAAADLVLNPSGSNINCSSKTLINCDSLVPTSGTNISISNGADSTKKILFNMSGATTGKQLTIVASMTNNHTQTIQDVADTFSYLSTADTLTNKTLTSPVINTTVTGNATYATTNATDATSTSTGSITTAGGISCAKAFYPGSIVLPTSGGTATPMIYNERTTQSNTWTWNGGTGSATFTLVRGANDEVRIQVPTTSIAGNRSGVVTSAGIPARFRPATDLFLRSILVGIAGVNVDCIFQVAAATGIITIEMQQGGSLVSASGITINAGSFGWIFNA